MRHPLIFEQSPPARIALPFFLIAPLFAAAAFGLLAFGGLDVAASRWDTRTIAAIHLFTLGYLLPVMMAAVLQMTPVLTGRPPLRHLSVARSLRLLLFTGSVLFAAGMYLRVEELLQLALLMLSAGALLFLYQVTRIAGSLRVMRARGPGRELVLAVAGFAVTAAFGLWLLAGHGWQGAMLARQWTDVHAGWAMLGWIAPLIMTASQVVIPMFQHTQPFPPWSAWLGPAAFAGMLLATFPHLRLAGLLLAGIAVTSFAVIVLLRQSGRRSATTDATLRLFRGAMVAVLGSVGAVAMMLLDGRTPLLELLAATLFLAGFAGACVMGMSFKIVPFLLRFHLQRELWQLALPARVIPSFISLSNNSCERWGARLYLTGLGVFAVAVTLHHDAVFRLAMLLLLAGQALALFALWHTVLRVRRLRREFRALAANLQEEKRHAAFT